MNFIALIPAVLGLLNNPAVQALLPVLQAVLSQVGKGAFPGVDPSKADQAAASLFDSNNTMWIQTALNLLGEKLTVDGVPGEALKAAVLKFQKAHPPLVADGWAGHATADELRKTLATLTTA